MCHKPTDERGNDQPPINPATGLPMLPEGWIDVGGSPYGVNVHQPVFIPEMPRSEDNWQQSWDGF